MADPGQYPIDPFTGTRKKPGNGPPVYDTGPTDAFGRAATNGPGAGTFGGVSTVGTGAGAPGGFNPYTIAGYRPDYKSLIQNDPVFGQLKSDLSANGISDAAARGSAVQRALVNFGEVPNFDALGGLNQGYLNQDVTANTRQLAQSNTDAGLSQTARLSKQLKDNLRAIRNALAARGALRSGETGYQLQEAQGGFDRARYDVSQEVLDYIGAAHAGFAAGERARQQQLSQGMESAANRQIGLNPATPDKVVKPGEPGYPPTPPDAPPVAPAPPGNAMQQAIAAALAAQRDPTDVISRLLQRR